MCDRKPSQTFFLPGVAVGTVGVILLYGTGVVTDLDATSVAAIDPQGGSIVRLRDGNNSRAPILYELAFDGATLSGGFHAANYEFQNGLFLETVQAGANFFNTTVGAYIQNESPDPMEVQLERIRE